MPGSRGGLPFQGRLPLADRCSGCLAAQETFEERVLRPLSKTQKYFVDFSTSLIIRNIISNDVTGDRTPSINPGFDFHCFLMYEREKVDTHQVRQ